VFPIAGGARPSPQRQHGADSRRAIGERSHASSIRRSTRAGAGSATLPVGSVYSSATINPRVREIGVFNTTATAVTVALCRMTTTGTQGAALTEQALDGTPPRPPCQGFNTHTVAPTLVDMGVRATLGAAVGSGMVWTFNNDTG
jgi:hypothetical protein